MSGIPTLDLVTLAGEQRHASHDAGYALGDAHGFQRGWTAGRQALLDELRTQTSARAELNSHPGTDTPSHLNEKSGLGANASTDAAGMGAPESLSIPPDPPARKPAAASLL